MSTSASRCDQIIALIDACLADVEGASGAQFGYPSSTLTNAGVSPAVSARPWNSR